MTVFVDPCVLRGWILRGQAVKSCHLFTDGDLQELHAMARLIGMKRSWFQEHSTLPHYDLTESRRAAAVQAGAKEVDRRETFRIMRQRAGLLPPEVSE